MTTPKKQQNKTGSANSWAFDFTARKPGVVLYGMDALAIFVMQNKDALDSMPEETRQNISSLIFYMYGQHHDDSPSQWIVSVAEEIMKAIEAES